MQHPMPMMQVMPMQQAAPVQGGEESDDEPVIERNPLKIDQQRL